MSDEKQLMAGLKKLGAGIDKLKASNRALATSLREMLPYAESRLEDMGESIAREHADNRGTAEQLYRQARIRFIYAKRTLAKLDRAEGRS